MSVLCCFGGECVVLCVSRVTTLRASSFSERCHGSADSERNSTKAIK